MSNKLIVTVYYRSKLNLYLKEPLYYLIHYYIYECKVKKFFTADVVHGF